MMPLEIRCKYPRGNMASWASAKQALRIYLQPEMRKRIFAHPFLPLWLVRCNTWAGVIW